jgi:hypothetical protein
MGKFIDLTGQKFGRLTVIKKEETKIKKIRWWCKCDCGNPELILVVTDHLKDGHTKSCGCLQKEIVSEYGKQTKKYNTYDLSGEYGIGYTSKNEPFYFDLEDYDKIKNYCWCYSSTYIISTDNNGKDIILMHQLISGYKSPDHKNRIRFDNRKENLRYATRDQNNYNNSIYRNNKTGIIGVCWDKKSNSWISQIGYNYKNIRLGFFDDFNIAVKNRLKAEQKYFGEFAPQKHLFKEYGIEEEINNEL